MDEERLIRLKAILDEQNQWPAVFLFKFIIANEQDKIQQLKMIFDESAEISTRKSGKGNYISISVKEMMLDSESIFDRYRKASEIEGIISL